MPVSKKFYEAASTDKALESEAEQAAYEALVGLLKERGLEEEAGKVVDAALARVAEAHGFESTDADELDLDELDAVAGGGCGCPVVGGGTGTGKQCACVFGGKGHNNSGKACFCPLVGGGTDDD